MSERFKMDKETLRKWLELRRSSASSKHKNKKRYNRTKPRSGKRDEN